MQVSGGKRIEAPRGAGPTQAEPAANEPDEEEIAKNFSKFDPDGSARISKDSLDDLMKALGIALSPEQLEQATAQLCPEGSDGFISYGDFLLWWRG